MLPLLNKYDNLLIRESGCGNIVGVKKAIDNGANVNAVDDEGNTALITVTMLGLDEPINENEDYIEVIKLLLLNDDLFSGLKSGKLTDDKICPLVISITIAKPDSAL